MTTPLPTSELVLFWPIMMEGSEKYSRQNAKPIDPAEVIHDFFGSYELADVRSDLWEWLKHTLKNPDMPGSVCPSIDDLIYLYEKLNDLITVNYILYQKNLPSKKEILLFDNNG